MDRNHELLDAMKRIRAVGYGSKFISLDKAILHILRLAEAAILAAEKKEGK